MQYIVVEIQTNADGTVGTIVQSFADLNEAESRFHGVLSAAAVSELPVHAASLLQSDGRLLNCGSYAHDAPEQPEEDASGEAEGQEVVE